MVFVRIWGLGGARKKLKNGEFEGSGTTFTSLIGRSGGCEEGVSPDRKSRNLWFVITSKSCHGICFRVRFWLIFDEVWVKVQIIHIDTKCVGTVLKIKKFRGFLWEKFFLISWDFSRLWGLLRLRGFLTKVRLLRLKLINFHDHGEIEFSPVFNFLNFEF